MNPLTDWHKQGLLGQSPLRLGVLLAAFQAGAAARQRRAQQATAGEDGLRAGALTPDWGGHWETTPTPNQLDRTASMHGGNPRGDPLFRFDTLAMLGYGDSVLPAGMWKRQWIPDRPGAGDQELRAIAAAAGEGLLDPEFLRDLTPYAEYATPQALQWGMAQGEIAPDLLMALDAYARPFDQPLAGGLNREEAMW